jgi:predicted PurR-regulated permease PerM
MINKISYRNPRAIIITTIVCLAVVNMIAAYILVLPTTTNMLTIDAKEIPAVFDDTYTNDSYNDIVPSSIELNTDLPESTDKL